MTDAAPRVSIGMPVYNGERYLKATLDAILAQDYPDLELVISDNGSTDATEAICRDYAADPRVRYVRHERNSGAAWNYNQVFALSRGTYFKWAAADDLILPGMIAQCAAVLDAHPEVVLCYPKTRIIDGEGRTLKDWEDNLDLTMPDPVSRFRQFLYSVSECNAVFGLIRADVLARTRRIGNFVGSDNSLLAELTLYGRFYEVPDRLFLRRDHAKASSADKSLEGQLAFFDPRKVGRLVFPYWRRLGENLRAAFTAPVPAVERVLLLGVLVRYLVRCRRLFVRDLRNGFRYAGGRVAGG
jgi:glycosyltransferase involved in cell wall biosynthesis